MGFDVENFSEVETVTFLQAFNAIRPKSDFVATKIFAAVGRDRAYIFFENGKDLCAPPTPMPRASYEALVEQARNVIAAAPQDSGARVRNANRTPKRTMVSTIRPKR